jgi:regulator of replication initiation timing
VGAAKLVAAAKLASERVAQAATALRDAESRAEVRRVELETLRALVAGNGTAGVVERAERYVSELPGAVARAREAVERRAQERLRAEEEARAQAETRAEVFRVELASVRELEVSRAKDKAGRGSAALPPIFSRSGEIAALTAEVTRLEKALAAATAKASTPALSAPATPESAAAAARVAAVAAADAAAEADAARERFRDTTPLVRRFAGWIVAGVLGEDPATRDALRRRVASLEKRLDATRVAAAGGPGSVCESALADAADATRRAEQRADAVTIDLDAARNVSLALAAGRGEESAAAGAAEALMAAADKHRKLLAAERSAARATLESCRGHAAAASQRAFVASKAAADTSDLFERHKLRLAAEALEARQEEAMLASLAPAPAPADGDAGVGAGAGFDAAATAAAAEAALEAIEEAELRAEALSRKFREAESRWRLAPGTLDWYEPQEYTRDDAYLFAFFSAALSGLAVLVASRSAIPWLALAKARLASVRHLLKRAQYDAEVMRERAEIAETATNEARAEAARQLYVGFEDGKNLGTVVDEMRANLRKTSELNEAVRHDNDWLRVKLREARDAQAAFMAAPEGGWANLRKVEEEQSSELAKLRVEVERLRSARLDATAVAAAAVREHLKAHPDESTAFASVAGDLKLGSPSFRAGMSAAREAAEREAAALRDESEALREANERLLAESARLRLENHELMEDLGGDGAPGVTAREAARAIREEMLAMTAVADAHAETIAAERAARAELAGRINALAGEATRERRAIAKVYFLGACVAAGCAVTSSASYGVIGVEPLTGKKSETAAFAAVSLAGLIAACLGSWALVFSTPNTKIKRLAAPVEFVALVDEELVVPSDLWAREAAKKEAEADTAREADAAEAETNAAALASASTSTSASTPAAAPAAAPVPAVPASGPDAVPASDDEELVLDDAEASVVGRAIRRVWRPETDVEEEAARAERDADISALRAELAGVRATADRLRQSRDRLKRRVRSARDENDALHSARDEVHSQAETMSLARSSVAGGDDLRARRRRGERARGSRKVASRATRRAPRGERAHGPRAGVAAPRLRGGRRRGGGGGGELGARGTPLRVGIGVAFGNARDFAESPILAGAGERERRRVARGGGAPAGAGARGSRRGSRRAGGGFPRRRRGLRRRGASRAHGGEGCGGEGG